MSEYGWLNKQVKNADGRCGLISDENGWGPWLDLHIECIGGGTAKVVLNARGADGGEHGWQWWCPEFSNVPAWLPLGENGAAIEYGSPPNG